LGYLVIIETQEQTMHTDLSTKPDFSQLSGQDLVRYNNAMVREILECGLTGYKEVSIFQNKDAGIKRCEANWSSLKVGRANVVAEAKEAVGAVMGRAFPAPGRSPVAEVASKKPRPPKPASDTMAIKIDKPLMLKIMLERGATVEAMCAALGWQAHTLRARISTSGIKVQRTRIDGVTSYRIVP
jgi:uncharacterized protein DUF3489